MAMTKRVRVTFDLMVDVDADLAHVLDAAEVTLGELLEHCEAEGVLAVTWDDDGPAVEEVEA